MVIFKYIHKEKDVRCHRKRFHEYKIIYLQWNEKYGKGIDDLIINNQTNKARRFKKETLDYIYGSLILNILKEYHEYEGPNKIPNELIKRNFIL